MEEYFLPINKDSFSFGPESKNYFIIDEKLASFLVEKLEEENY